MKIELEEPFKSLWKLGYVVTNPENRRNVILFNNQDDRTTISYARYLMCVKLGYILSDEYEVDHIDDDKTNDDINNLQVLTKEQNKLKQEYNYIMNQQVVYGVYCAWCRCPFLMTQCDLNVKIKNGVKYPFCSRSCASNFHHTNTDSVKRSLSDDSVARIRSLRAEGKSSYAISRETGFAKNTVMKYW